MRGDGLEGGRVFCELEPLAPKNSRPKRGHNVLIWYLLHAGCLPTGKRPMGIAEDNGTTFSHHTGPTERNRTHTIFYSFSGNQPVCQKWNGKFLSERIGVGLVPFFIPFSAKSFQLNSL